MKCFIPTNKDSTKFINIAYQIKYKRNYLLQILAIYYIFIVISVNIIRSDIS